MGARSCVDAVGRSVAAAEIRMRMGRKRGRKRRAAGGVSGVCLICGVTAGITTGVCVSLTKVRGSTQRGSANRFLEDRLGEEGVTGRRFYRDRGPGACPCVQLSTLLT